MTADRPKQSRKISPKQTCKGVFDDQDVFDFLGTHRTLRNFEIIFADPPYEKTKPGESFTEKLLTDETLPQLLEPGGIFVLEKRPGEVLPEMKLWRSFVRKHTAQLKCCFYL